MSRPMVDASALLARLDGRSDRTAARMCGVVPQTISRWRATGQASPHALTRATAHLDTLTSATTQRPGNPNLVDVHCTQTSTGWIVDAYVAGTNRPNERLAIAARKGQRFPTLADAHRFARRIFGPRLAQITPPLETDQ